MQFHKVRFIQSGALWEHYNPNCSLCLIKRWFIAELETSQSISPRVRGGQWDAHQPGSDYLTDLGMTHVIEQRIVGSGASAWTVRGVFCTCSL